MRRMLDPTKVGGIPSNIEFDKDGNRKVKKNLNVGGKLTLTSLVSTSNPDGDITKELGGGGSTLYEYSAVFIDNSNLGIRAYAKFNSSADIGEENKPRTSQELNDKLLPGGGGYELSLNLSGYVKINTTYYSLIRMTFGRYDINMYYLDPTQGMMTYSHNFKNDKNSIWNVIRNIASPRHK